MCQQSSRILCGADQKPPQQLLAGASRQQGLLPAPQHLDREDLRSPVDRRPHEVVLRAAVRR